MQVEKLKQSQRHNQFFHSDVIYIGAMPPLIYVSSPDPCSSVWVQCQVTSVHEWNGFTHMWGDTTGGSSVQQWQEAGCLPSLCAAKVNRWASHLFTPLPAVDRESHGTESSRSTSKKNHGQSLTDVLIALSNFSDTTCRRWNMQRWDVSVAERRDQVPRCLVYIPTLNMSRLTPQINFRKGRWSGEELVKFKQFSDVFSNSLDLSMGQRPYVSHGETTACLFCFSATFVTYLRWKTDPLQLHAGNPRCGTSSTKPGHQKLTTFELSLLETAKQDVSRQTSWRVSRHFEGRAT